MELSVRRLFLPGGTRSGGPYKLRLPIFLQPLGWALKNRSAAPASPPCFRRRRWSAPLLFESTLAALYKLPDKTETPVSLQHWSSWWARVDYASRASKKAPQAFLPPGRIAAADAVRIHLESETSVFYKTKSPAYFCTLSFFGGAKQPKSEPLPSGASLAAISSKVMVFVPSS